MKLRRRQRERLSLGLQYLVVHRHHRRGALRRGLGQAGRRVLPRRHHQVDVPDDHHRRAAQHHPLHVGRVRLRPRVRHHPGADATVPGRRRTAGWRRRTSSCSGVCPRCWCSSSSGTASRSPSRSARFPGGVFGSIAIGLGLTAAAYMAETIRAGIQAVPKGQMEAARTLGMSHFTAMRTIVIPQAFRIVIPPLTNELILLTKDSSLVYVLGRDGADHRDHQVRPGHAQRPGERHPAAGGGPGLPGDHPAAVAAWYDASNSATPRLGDPHDDHAHPDPAVEIQRPAQVVRAARGAQGHRLRGRPGRGGLRHRAVRVRQVDPVALRQPAGAADGRQDLGRTGSR